MDIVRKKLLIPLAFQCCPHCLFLPQSGEEIHSHFLIHRDFHYSDASESQILLKIAYAGKKRRNPLVSFFLSLWVLYIELMIYMKAACFLHVHFIDYNEKTNNQKSQQGRGPQRHIFSWSSTTSPCPEDSFILRYKCMKWAHSLKKSDKNMSLHAFYVQQPVLLSSFWLWGWYEHCLSIKFDTEMFRWF